MAVLASSVGLAHVARAGDSGMRVTWCGDDQFILEPSEGAGVQVAAAEATIVDGASSAGAPKIDRLGGAVVVTWSPGVGRRPSANFPRVMYIDSLETAPSVEQLKAVGEIEVLIVDTSDEARLFSLLRDVYPGYAIVPAHPKDALRSPFVRGYSPVETESDNRVEVGYTGAPYAIPILRLPGALTAACPSPQPSPPVSHGCACTVESAERGFHGGGSLGFAAAISFAGRLRRRKRTRIG
jgi:hypothetical protein